MKTIINSTIDWSKSEKSIRAVILVGSRATDLPVDELSDYDLSIFLKDDSQFIQNDQWLSKIGKVWVCVHEKIYWENREVPTRLVIFEGGVKVDFAFYPLEIMQKLCSSLPSEYRIILDKDEIAQKPQPRIKSYHTNKPTELEFLNVIKEFWFEAYHVAVYLKRGDLWSAKVRSEGIRQNFLLKMIEWDELSRHDWNYAIPPMGKSMQTWVCEKTWNALFGTFAHFDEQDSWQALHNIMELFRNLAKETAQKLEFKYPLDVDQNICEFINRLSNGCFKKGL